MVYNSSKPGKQRAETRRASFTKRRKLVSARLSPALSEAYGRRSVPVRRGDTVQVQRGDYSEISGKVLRVDYKSGRVQVEGATRERVDGRPAAVLIHASKVLVTKLDLEDELRARSLGRVKAAAKAEEKTSTADAS
ncbi:MAG: 50S ribosomal protein L24 [Candidatus Bathyarchaeia archaeon]